MRLRVLSTIKQRLSLLLKHVDLIFEYTDLVFKVALFQFVDVYDVMIPMLTNSAPKANTTGTVLTEAFDIFATMVQAPEDIVILLAFLILLATGTAGTT